MPNIKETVKAIKDSDNPELVLDRFCFDLMTEIIHDHFLPKSAEKFYGADVVNILRDACPIAAPEKGEGK